MPFFIGAKQISAFDEQVMEAFCALPDPEFSEIEDLSVQPTSDNTLIVLEREAAFVKDDHFSYVGTKGLNSCVFVCLQSNASRWISHFDSSCPCIELPPEADESAHIHVTLIGGFDNPDTKAIIQGILTQLIQFGKISGKTIHLDHQFTLGKNQSDIIVVPDFTQPQPQFQSREVVLSMLEDCKQKLIIRNFVMNLQTGTIAKIAEAFATPYEEQRTAWFQEQLAEHFEHETEPPYLTLYDFRKGHFLTYDPIVSSLTPIAIPQTETVDASGLDGQFRRLRIVYQLDESTNIVVSTSEGETVTTFSDAKRNPSLFNPKYLGINRNFAQEVTPGISENALLKLGTPNEGEVDLTLILRLVAILLNRQVTFILNDDTEIETTYKKYLVEHHDPMLSNVKRFKLGDWDVPAKGREMLFTLIINFDNRYRNIAEMLRLLFSVFMPCKDMPMFRAQFLEALDKNINGLDRHVGIDDEASNPRWPLNFKSSELISAKAWEEAGGNCRPFF